MRSISSWLGHTAVRAQHIFSCLTPDRPLWAKGVAVADEGRFKEGLVHEDSCELLPCFDFVRLEPQSELDGEEHAPLYCCHCS